MASPANAIDRLDLSISEAEFNELANRKGYIGTRVLTLFGSATESGKIIKLPLEAMLNSTADPRRAVGAPYQRDNFKTEDDTFQTEELGWEGVADDKQAKIYGDVERYNRIVARRCAMKVLDYLERQTVAAVYNTTTWAGPNTALSTTPSVPWATVATSKPITDIQNAMDKVFDSSGEEANAVIINARQSRLITQSSEYRGMFVATDHMHDMLAANIARAAGIQYVIISGAAKNTANPKQTFSLSRMWSNTYAMVCRIGTTDELDENCIGRTIYWTDEVMEGDEPYPIKMEQYREEAVRGGVHRARTETKLKIVNPNCGHLLIVG